MKVEWLVGVTPAEKITSSGWLNVPTGTKTPSLEALRCAASKRRISDARYRKLLTEPNQHSHLQRRACWHGPGKGTEGRHSHPARPTAPHIDTSHQPLPGPAKNDATSHQAGQEERTEERTPDHRLTTKGSRSDPAWIARDPSGVTHSGCVPSRRYRAHLPGTSDLATCGHGGSLPYSASQVRVARGDFVVRTNHGKTAGSEHVSLLPCPWCPSLLTPECRAGSKAWTVTCSICVSRVARCELRCRLCPEALGQQARRVMA